MNETWFTGGEPDVRIPFSSLFSLMFSKLGPDDWLVVEDCRHRTMYLGCGCVYDYTRAHYIIRPGQSDQGLVGCDMCTDYGAMVSAWSPPNHHACFSHG